MPDARQPRGPEVTEQDTMVHRQVSPVCWSQEGRPTSQAFKPRPGDCGFLSLTHGGPRLHGDGAADSFDPANHSRSPQEAWRFATTVAKLNSLGTLTAKVSDFNQPAMTIRAPVFADPCTETEDGFDDPAHLVADYGHLTRGQIDKLASALRQTAGAMSFSAPAAPPEASPAT